MKIGIEGSLFSVAPRGRSIYTRRLCAELGNLMPDAEFIVYSGWPLPEFEWPGNWQVRCQGNRTARISPVAWLKLTLGGMLRQDALDLFWSPYSFLPVTPRGLPTVLTIYDFVYQEAPDSFHPLHRLAFQLFLQRDASRATRVMTISRGVQARIRSQLGVDSLVIPPGLDDRFQRPAVTTVNEVCRRHGLQAPYILAVAAWDPRKNLASLIRAYQGLQRDGQIETHHLVLVGRTDRAQQSVRDLLEAPGSEKIHCLGYVPDEDLPALYAGADVFAFPSLYEGYGMPVAEALACGTPVIASDLPEIHEAEGEGCLYIEPTEAGIRQALLQSLTPPGLAIHASPRRAWRDSAALLAAEFRRLLGNCIGQARPDMRP